jgi:hypothetical protein
LLKPEKYFVFPQQYRKGPQIFEGYPESEDHLDIKKFNKTL